MSYQPLPAALVGQTTILAFIYVSADALVKKTLAEIWGGEQMARDPGQDHARTG